MALNELSPKKIENAKPKDADYKLTDGGSPLIFYTPPLQYWRGLSPLMHVHENRHISGEAWRGKHCAPREES